MSFLLWLAFYAISHTPPSAFENKEQIDTPFRQVMMLTLSHNINENNDSGGATLNWTHAIRRIYGRSHFTAHIVGDVSDYSTKRGKIYNLDCLALKIRSV